MKEFNPQLGKIPAGALGELIVAKKHGIHPEQAERIAALSNEDLVCFRCEDPMSAHELTNGLSLTGGHHRINEIIRRVQEGLIDPACEVEVLIHD